MVDPLEIDLGGHQIAQGIDVEWIQLIRRELPGELLEEQIARRVVQTEVVVQPVPG
jgi:hypothetical protein